MPKTNRQITASSVRLIDESGTMQGVVQLDFALSKASDIGLDLVEISPKADPPVCKIMDFGKYKYESKRNSQKAKKKQKVTEIKEIRVRPAIGDHDLNIKINQIKNELSEQKKALNNADSEDELKQAEDGTKEIWHKIDKLEKSGEWGKVEKELQDALESLENLIEKDGDDNDRKMLNEILQKVNKITEMQNIGLAKDVLQEIFSLEFNVLRKSIGWWISWIKEYDENFENHDWKNKIAARNELSKAKENIMNEPSLEILENSVRKLWDLLVDPETGFGVGKDGNLLRA